jgi:hypothetical protein
MDTHASSMRRLLKLAYAKPHVRRMPKKEPDIPGPLFDLAVVTAFVVLCGQFFV